MVFCLSIHDLSRRSTFCVIYPFDTWNLSIHDLSRRSTHHPVRSCTLCFSFNSRPLKEVDVFIPKDWARYTTFQFTTSQGGRLVSIEKIYQQGLFQFTTSQGGRRHCFCVFCYRFNSFNSRPLKEVDPTGSGKNYTLEPFNSRPLKEVDTIDIVHNPNRLDFQFTTSQGGRRSQYATISSLIILSIHDLSRRSTISTLYVRFMMISFNSRPLKEVDRIAMMGVEARRTFNSRPLKEVDNDEKGNRGTEYLFQFTTSQGGRRYLQSRYPASRKLSIHDLSRRSTIRLQPTH